MACLTTFVADFALCCFFYDDDDGIIGYQISERVRQNSLGVEMGERGGGIGGERGFLWLVLGYCLVVGWNDLSWSMSLLLRYKL